MSGTRDRVEGNVELIAESTYSSGSTPLNSLEGINISSLQDGATCFVRMGALSFRWFQDDTSAPSPTVILPSQLTVSDPGRWIEITGGGGGGGVNSLIGINGIAIINPVGPAVTVNGIALYARDGSNGAMLANMNMGGFGITNVTSVASAGALTVSAAGALNVTSVGALNVTSTGALNVSATGALGVSSTGAVSVGGASLTLDGGVDALIWPSVDGTSGQALVTDGAGNLSFATVSATPATPNKSVQYNNSGAFGGSSRFTFEPAAAGVGPQLFLDSSGTSDAGTGYVIRNSLGATVATFTFSEDPVPANYFTTLSGAGLFQIDAFNGVLELKATNNLLLTRGLVTWTWPAADGTAGQALVTNGAGALSFASTAVVPTVQNIAVAGPTAITNTMNTVALVNFAGAASVVLPAHAVGKQITVKDSSGAAGTNNISITAASGNIDGSASQTIATNYGSMTFISDGSNWWAI